MSRVIRRRSRAVADEVIDLDAEAEAAYEGNGAAHDDVDEYEGGGETADHVPEPVRAQALAPVQVGTVAMQPKMLSYTLHNHHPVATMVTRMGNRLFNMTADEVMDSRASLTTGSWKYPRLASIREDEGFDPEYEAGFVKRMTFRAGRPVWESDAARN
ncbi:MAG: hypothetical protein ACRD0F_04150 [Acidimicrobiales bacterium]